MPITYSDLLYTAINNALRGTTALQNPSVDAIGIADTLFDQVSQSVSMTAAMDEYKRSLLRREKSITLVAGTATLTDDVFTSYVADATLIDPNSLSKHYAWRDYPDFIRRGDPRIGIFTVSRGNIFQVIDPNANFAVPLTAIGARTLTIPCAVQKPALPTDDVDCPEEIISNLIEGLTESLRGEVSKIAGEAA